MNNYAGSFNHFRDDSFIPKSERPITMDPLKLLRSLKVDFILKLTGEMEHSDEEANLLFNSLKVIITYLKPLRLSELATINYLHKALNDISYGIKLFTINFLLSVIDSDVTYDRAFNYLAQVANRDQFSQTPMKNINVPLIILKIEQENEDEMLKIATNKTQPSENQTKLIPLDTPETIEKTLSEIRKSDNGFWKGLPMEKVVEHFKILSSRENKNGNTYLTIEQLISFLKKGFLNDTTQPKQKINCTANEKGFVINRFYQLYDLSVAQYGHPAKKAKFIDLFTDCFDNWDKDSVVTFFKPNKVKENW